MVTTVGDARIDRCPRCGSPGYLVADHRELKAVRCRELRSVCLHLPSHYAYTACQDAFTRVKSFLKLKKKGLVNKEHLEVKSIPTMTICGNRSIH